MAMHTKFVSTALKCTKTRKPFTPAGFEPMILRCKFLSSKCRLQNVDITNNILFKTFRKIFRNMDPWTRTHDRFVTGDGVRQGRRPVRRDRGRHQVLGAGDDFINSVSA
jgi:hypothetical protein